MIKENSFASAYKKALELVYNNPDYKSSPRGFKIKEVMNLKIEITNPYNNLFFNDVKSSARKYIVPELKWYLSGDLSSSYISQYAKLWDHIKDENGNVCSNYGNLIWYKNINNHKWSNVQSESKKMTQWQWALNSLLNDKDSRQAIIRFNSDNHQLETNKDFVCTMYGIFHIRDNKLNFSISMRSSDAIYGFANDYPFFSIIHQQMLLNLKDKYKDLKMGTFTYFGNSFHIYEKHFELVEKMLMNKFYEDMLPIVDKKLVDDNSMLTEDSKLFIMGKRSESKFLNKLLENK